MNLSVLIKKTQHVPSKTYAANKTKQHNRKAPTKKARMKAVTFEYGKTRAPAIRSRKQSCWSPLASSSSRARDADMIFRERDTPSLTSDLSEANQAISAVQYINYVSKTRVTPVHCMFGHFVISVRFIVWKISKSKGNEEENEEKIHLVH